ncbi:Porphobilinogen synthase [Hydrogenobacter thermophilus TK-6]|uniref:Delta-aminolevulinic acid dehydratase n=1 Tax=Hydrogenobacter thermophilus (strain DSM 6534 / IAM 12695 / TK-6) TaxID=608538 RepID=D3DGJ5_HYDTT|nr:porphobilinogen synthase [Hydrogenobacter thermophilus]ADO44882.1 Porphobilinogen synthase [Hydrogenobacter thermophilus TK-6]BAI68947.1 delta-aminolevulinic acid dehydratase [Hydrogenobacter thermophilus TK-6]
MEFPKLRPRRLRSNESIRRLVRETKLSLDDLICPVFVRYGEGIEEEVPSMPGVFRYSPDKVIDEVKKIRDLGIPAIILFGIPEHKDEVGSDTWSKEGIIQRTVRLIKKEVPDIYVITDVCFCEYTTHGHCGVLKNHHVDNDATLENLKKQAVSHAESGADMLAPSGMMDGMVKAIRSALDEANFYEIPIMAYSAKFASAFYGPFRDAAQSAPAFGDRRTYQMDPSNAREALKEVLLDLQEGADIVMVKPALSYLDIIYRVKEATLLPVCAYNVSGEYSMIKAAGKLGWIDERKVMWEVLTSIKRAGADMIITYFAKDVAILINRGELA